MHTSCDTDTYFKSIMLKLFERSISFVTLQELL